MGRGERQNGGAGVKASIRSDRSSSHRLQCGPWRGDAAELSLSVMAAWKDRFSRGGCTGSPHLRPVLNLSFRYSSEEKLVSKFSLIFVFAETCLNLMAHSTT